MTPILCVLLEIPTLLTVEKVYVVGLLLVIIAGLIKYIQWRETKVEKDETEAKASKEKALQTLKDDHEKELTRVEKRVVELIEANNRLQEEKYQITREVIPLLIELIQKLNKDEQH